MFKNQKAKNQKKKPKPKTAASFKERVILIWENV